MASTSGPAAMSYFPEHVFPQPSPTTEPTVEPDASTSSETRRCSVKGCSKPLPNDYTLKMCETCRGRHRIYATTKRAKRKMEKAAVGQQRAREDEHAVTWMPPDDMLDMTFRDAIVEPNLHLVWSPQIQIDPRLFNPTSSELAGALTLPPINSSASTSTAPDDSEDEGASPNSNMTLQPRYCSVKGCKNVVAGDYLFKMCETCRDRYRHYGNTKRSKWKREREASLAELAKHREDEDVRREKEGLPLIADLPASERRAWEGSVINDLPPPSPSSYSSSTLPVRMCTVSHCHEVLPGQYPYRRCEQHRLQNRHHSKLKRVRDKDIKAIPFASVTPEASKGNEPESDSLYTSDPLGLETTEEQAQNDEEDTEEVVEEVISSHPAVPPAARGIRRTIHVCSIKGCHNILNPNSPWKMCDPHREKDRASRKRKSERELVKKLAEESGGMVFMAHDGQSRASIAQNAVLPNTQVPLDGEVDDLEEAHDGPLATVNASMANSTAMSSMPLGTSKPAAIPVVFMDPLLPPEPEESSDRPTPASGNETLMSGLNGATSSPPLDHVSPPSDHTPSFTPSHPPNSAGAVSSPAPAAATSAGAVPSTESTIGNAEPPAKKKRGPYKRKAQDSNSTVWRVGTATGTAGAGPSSATAPSSSTANIAAENTGVATPSAGPSPAGSATSSSAANATPTHMQPQFQVPYYMPPPFSMPFQPGQPPYYVHLPYPPRAPYAAYGAPFQSFQPLPTVPLPGSLQGYPPRYGYPAWGPYVPPAPEANTPNVQAQQAAPKKTSKRKRDANDADKDATKPPEIRFVTAKPAAQRKPRRKAVMTSAEAAAAVAAAKAARQASTSTTAAPSPAPMGSLAPDPVSAAEPPIVALLTSSPPPSAGFAPPASLSVSPDALDITSSPVEAPTPLEEVQLTKATRPCSNCNRRMPMDAPGTRCDRCRQRMKKHQERTKKRLRLEPRRSTTGTRQQSILPIGDASDIAVL
ncbi:hypothetical protein FA95DRAFT_1563936 [Auriscalpium vulgare]|uniref:Uncharacterized protein n=1 Tax=Auriscalpium vulgare TaxID=40419 RepID=A0ACB8RFZ4_9AGAM|nr:hypothetical protein FA95DRAFT_1563936 [Auriscalpium vulgare]